MNPEDKIESIVQGNLGVFNSDEPPAGHFERFEMRLEREKRGLYFKTRNLWKVAAAVVFVLLAVNQVRMWLSPGEESPITLASVMPEYAEVEHFYRTTIQEGVDAWHELVSAGMVTSGEYAIMEMELEDFEKRYEELRKEFEANPYDERIVNALLEYYQAKLNVITMIVSKLSEVKQEKYRSHEKEL